MTRRADKCRVDTEGRVVMFPRRMLMPVDVDGRLSRATARDVARFDVLAAVSNVTVPNCSAQTGPAGYDAPLDGLAVDGDPD